MSVRLMNLVCEAEVGSIKYQEESGEVRTLSQPDKAVLLAMADCAADDGSSVFLGVERLTWKTELSERSVRESLRHLRQAGVITITKAAAWHYTPHYRINVALIRGARRAGLDNEPGVQEAQVSGEQGVQEAQVSGLRGAPGAVRGAAGAPNPSVTISRVNSNRQKKQSNQSQKQHPAPNNGAAVQAQVVLGVLLPEAVVALEAPLEVPTPSSAARPAGPTPGSAAVPGAPDRAATVAPAPRSPAAAAPARRGHPGIALFFDRWKAHYGKPPTINSKRIGILARIYDGLGPEASEEYPRLLDAFFGSTDRFIVVDNAHSPEVFQTKLDALRVNGAGSTPSKLGPHGEATARAGLAWMRKKLAATDGAPR